MKHVLPTKKILSSGIKSTIECSIKTNAKTYALLYKSIYSDPIKAIIRELSVNSIDSHKEAATSKKFLIELPSSSSPFFSVRDYGVGMKREKIEGLYATIGDSDKDKSNKCTGYWGIGSKSPLAYTNQFNIDSYIDGEHHSYTLIINQEGIPELNYFGSEESDEPTGFKVSFMVKSGDFYLFRQKALELAGWFEIKPKILHNGHEENITDNLTKDNLSVKHSLPDVWCKGYNHLLLMGSIPYPIDKGIITVPNWMPGLTIKARIGDVDITGSRESLEYTNKTKDFLKRKLKEYEVFVDKTLNDGVAAQKTNYAKHDWITKNFVYSFKGIEDYCNPYFKINDPLYKEATLYIDGKKQRQPKNKRFSTTNLNISNLYVIIDDLNKVSEEKKEGLKRVRYLSETGDCILINQEANAIVGPHTKSTIALTLTKDYIVKNTSMDEPSRVFLLSELPDPPIKPKVAAPPRTTPKRPKGMIRLLEASTYDDVYFPQDQKGEIYYAKRVFGKEEDFLGENCEDLLPPKYYLSNARELPKVEKNPAFIHISKFVEAKAKELFNNEKDEILEYIAITNLKDKYVKFINEVKDHYKPLKTIHGEIEKIKKKYKADTIHAIVDICKVNKSRATSPLCDSTLDFWAKLNKILKDSQIEDLCRHWSGSTLGSILSFLETIKC